MAQTLINTQIDCEACAQASEPINPAELEAFLCDHPDWQLEDMGGLRLILKQFPFKNFSEALAFTNDIGAFAETNNHHPSIMTEWGSVTLSWWTHSIQDIHRIDTMMALHCDRIYDRIYATQN